MSITLENLPAKLVRHHEKVRDVSSSINVKAHEQDYVIAKLGVKVLVKMERTNIEIAEERAFCGGKLSIDKAWVIIYPPNAKVERVVSAHFKSQIIPPFFSVPAMPMFDEVLINNRKIGL